MVVTVGALEGLTLCLLALLNRDDEILVPDPCFANYYGQAMIAGAKAVPVPAHEENGFNMTAADVEKCITPKTKAIILNSPCNPTGAVMSREDVLAIAEVVKKHDLWVFSDEPYDAIVYDGVEAFSMAQVDDVRDHVIVLNGFSKTYAMTGWRVGYLLVPDAAYVPKFAALQEGLVSCVSSFSQVACAEALKSTDCVKSMLADYTRRRDILADGINAIPGFTCAEAQGQLLRLCEYQGLWKDLSGVCRGADQGRTGHLRTGHRLRRYGRGLPPSGVRQLRRQPEGSRPPHRRLHPQGISRYEVTFSSCTGGESRCGRAHKI